MECLTIAALGPEEPDAGSTPDDEGQNTFVTEFLADHPPPNHTHLKRLLKSRMQICRKVLEKVFSSHVVDNAFFKLNFGPNPSGIFGATPTDLMHAFEEGLVPYFLHVLIDPLLPRKVRYIA